MATTQSNFTIMVADGLERTTVPTGDADDIHAALSAAWQLNRYTESPIGIWDNRDGTPRKIAVVRVEWLEG